MLFYSLIYNVLFDPAQGKLLMIVNKSDVQYYMTLNRQVFFIILQMHYFVMGY